MGGNITFDYLNNQFATPIAVLHAKKMPRKDSSNCFNIGNKLPSIPAICVGSKVMLQQNFVIEQNLMNGAIGIVVDICYMNKDGPYGNVQDQSEYVVVDFPNSTLTEALVPGSPPTFISVPVDQMLCDRKCYTCSTVLLRVCIVISMHKSQGTRISDDQIFKRCMLYPPMPGQTPVPGMEIVSLSRSKKPTDMAIGNNMNKLKYHSMIVDLAEKTNTRILDQITHHDKKDLDKTFDGGCSVLLEWYRDRVGT
jgi:hypothetical protein